MPTTRVLRSGQRRAYNYCHRKGLERGPIDTACEETRKLVKTRHLGKTFAWMARGRGSGACRALANTIGATPRISCTGPGLETVGASMIICAVLLGEYA